MKTEVWTRQVGIIGAGAVGSVLGHQLQESLGIVPVFFGRQGPLAHRPRLMIEGKEVARDFPLPTGKDLLGLKVIFLTVKAHQLLDAIHANVKFLPRDVSVVVLSNGMIDDEMGRLARFYSNYIWRRGVVTHAAKRLEPGRWQVTNAHGTLAFGPWNGGDDALKPIERDIVEGLPGTRWEPNVATLVREKWLFNTSLNTLCGELSLTSNGDALAHRDALRNLFEEAFALGRELWGDWESNGDELFERLLRLIQETAQNQNSLVRDLQLGVMTESPFMAGVLSRSKSRFPSLERAHKKILWQSLQVS